MIESALIRVDQPIPRPDGERKGRCVELTVASDDRKEGSMVWLEQQEVERRWPLVDLQPLIVHNAKMV